MSATDAPRRCGQILKISMWKSWGCVFRKMLHLKNFIVVVAPIQVCKHSIISVFNERNGGSILRDSVYKGPLTFPRASDRQKAATGDIITTKDRLDALFNPRNFHPASDLPPRHRIFTRS